MLLPLCGGHGGFGGVYLQLLCFGEARLYDRLEVEVR